MALNPAAPRSAYIHVPFCRHRCGYCNFSVVAGRDELIDRYLRAIDCELEQLGRPAVQTVFVGGGTPTHLPTQQLEQLLRMVKKRFELDGEYEWSIEANPEDISTQKLQLLVSHGVNRISLGVQSFDDEKLRLLERGHSGQAAREAIALTAEHIVNVSIDLIFAVPDELLDGWRADLEAALAQPIQHLSTYALTVEKGTSFWSRRNRGELPTPGESTEVEMYQLARVRAADAAMEHYEISNFSMPGFQCRHNLAYWEGKGWYAAGPGAARFVDGRREVNHRSTSTYLRRIESQQSPTSESESITAEQMAREQAAFGVRLIEGIDLRSIDEATGVDLRGLCASEIDRLINEGLLHESEGHVRLTERGILFADTVASRFLG